MMAYALREIAVKGMDKINQEIAASKAAKPCPTAPVPPGYTSVDDQAPPFRGALDLCFDDGEHGIGFFHQHDMKFYMSLERSEASRIRGVRAWKIHSR
jgi:hypothetical protein